MQDMASQPRAVSIAPHPPKPYRGRPPLTYQPSAQFQARRSEESLGQGVLVTGQPASQRAMPDRSFTDIPRCVIFTELALMCVKQIKNGLESDEIVFTP